ncbi:MAG: hypothetical protein ABIJ15_01130 [bacterium]
MKNKKSKLICSQIVTGLFCFLALPFLSVSPVMAWGDGFTITLNVLGDVTDPQAVTDLTASTTGTPGEVELTWTAPHEDGTNGGAVASFEIRGATFSINSLSGDTTVWWAAATGQVFYTPKNPGETETKTIDLALGNTYYFAVRSKDECNNESLIDEKAATPGSQTFCFVPLFPPANPGNFIGIVMSTGSIKWSWDDVDNETGYRIISGTGGIMQTLNAAATCWLETNLSANTSCYRYAEAYNASGSSASVPDIKFTLARPPAGSYFTGVSSGCLTVTWSENGNPSYTRWGVLSSTDNFISTNTLTNFAANYTNTSYIDSELMSAVTYWYKIQAFNEAGTPTSFDTVISTITMELLPPAGPSVFTGIVQSTDSIKWLWDDVDNETGYRIISGTGGIMQTLNAAATCWLETNLSANTSYHRYAEAYNTGGSSASASDVKFTLARPPAAVTALLKTEHSIKISWSGNGGTGFKIEHSTDELNWTTREDWDSGFSSVTYSDVKLLQDTTYYYRIYAYNGDGIITGYAAFEQKTDEIKEEIINISSATTVGEEGEVEVEVPPGSFDKPCYIKISTDPVNKPIEVIPGKITAACDNLGTDLTGLTGTITEFQTYDLYGATVSLSTAVVISLPYLDSDPEDGFIDVPAGSPQVLARTLRVYWLNVSSLTWERIGGDVDKKYKVVRATVSHFSVYMLIGEKYTASSNLNNVIVYPNPFKPNNSGSVYYADKLTFKGLPAEKVKIKIFNIAGELAAEPEDTRIAFDKPIEWCPPENLASGVYIYVITGSGNKAVGKFAVIK